MIEKIVIWGSLALNLIMLYRFRKLRNQVKFDKGTIDILVENNNKVVAELKGVREETRKNKKEYYNQRTSINNIFKKLKSATKTEVVKVKEKKVIPERIKKVLPDKKVLTESEKSLIEAEIEKNKTQSGI